MLTLSSYRACNELLYLFALKMVTVQFARISQSLLTVVKIAAYDI